MLISDLVIASQVLTPNDLDEVARILQEASLARSVVIPIGGGTMLDFGAPLDRANPSTGSGQVLAVSLGKLNHVLDYQPANLTVRTEAGITLDALNQTLAKGGQFLPLDPPCPDRATIGGILATNASGALRVRYGAARDLLIGIRVALTDGQIVRGGGQVVKNVAGYDLPKLFIGSLGTLGMIVEATFKLAPLPKKTATLVASFAGIDHAGRVAARLLASPLLPIGVEVLNAPVSAQFALGDSPALAVRFGGIESAITRQLRDVEQWAQENASLTTATVENDTALWARVRDFAAQHPTVVKVSVLTTQIAEMARAAQNIAQTHGLSCALMANAVGIVLCALEGADKPMAQAIGEIAQVATSMRGHSIVQRAPLELRQSLDVWGTPRGDWAAMRKIKREFDPNGILNPGRFVV